MHLVIVVLETLLRPLGKLLRNRRADPSLSVGALEAFAAQRVLSVTSSSFRNNEPLPKWAGGTTFGDNVSPQLGWSALPAGTQQLLLILEDVDSPGKAPTLHTVAALPGDKTGLAQGELSDGGQGLVLLPASRGNRGYFGPRPLPDHGVHRYIFHVYALDLPLRTDHVLAAGSITGTAVS